jgi:hypothetical protein
MGSTFHLPGPTFQSAAHTHIGIPIDTDEAGVESNTHEEDTESNSLNTSADVDEEYPNNDLLLPSVPPHNCTESGQSQSDV